MWNSSTVMMIVEGTFATIYMTLLSTLMAYVIGLPVGVTLVVTGREGLKPNAAVNKVLDVIVNITRSIPLTRAIVGKSYGPSATVVPLTLAAAPFVARLVESSLLEVDRGVIEAAQSMGAGIPTIVTKVMLLEARSSLLSNLAIALGTILGYSAMAGAVGGGGLGDIAIRYGYNRYEFDIMIVTVILLVLLVQIMQVICMKLARKLDRRSTG